MKHAIDFVCPDLLTAEPSVFGNRAILAPTKISVSIILNTAPRLPATSLAYSKHSQAPKRQ